MELLNPGGERLLLAMRFPPHSCNGIGSQDVHAPVKSLFTGIPDHHGPSRWQQHTRGKHTPPHIEELSLGNPSFFILAQDSVERLGDRSVIR